MVLPVFALILAGWAARRTGALGPAATRELNRFVVYLALPALLFDIVAGAEWAELWRPGFIGAFGLGTAAVFGAILMAGRKRPLADAAIDGLNGSYANTGFLGFPLAFAALGPAASTPTLIATVITVCILFGSAIMLIEAALNSGRDARRPVVTVGLSLIRNPLLIAPALGALVPLTGVETPAPIESFLDLLGAAASPCALVAIGLFLAAERPRSERQPRDAAVLVGIKLLVHPLVTWALATFVFRLPAPLVHAALLLAALPTGTGPFILAEGYQRRAAVTADVILISTVLSVATITAYLAMVR